jgi:Flp pilus assembly pilin Flp
MLRTLFADENGFIVSAELVLIATLLVIGLIVGLSEVQHAVVQELNDVGEAIGELNQSYCFSGFHSYKGKGCGSFVAGSSFSDHIDECDHNECAIACAAPQGEQPKW